MFHPCVLQGSEDFHIEWLEFVSHFKGEAVMNDRGAGGVAGHCILGVSCNV